MVNVRERNGIGDVDAALVFPAHGDVWRFLVEPDTEAFELRFDETLVTERLEDIEDDENEIACSGDYCVKARVRLVDFGALAEGIPAMTGSVSVNSTAEMIQVTYLDDRVHVHHSHPR